MTEQSKPAAARFDVAGGYNHEGVTYSIGINSGSGGIGLGVSDQAHAILNGGPQTVSLHISLTPDEAEQMGQALVAHAEAVRARIAEREARQEPSANITQTSDGVAHLTAHSPFFPRDFDEPKRAPMYGGSDDDGM